MLDDKTTKDETTYFGPPSM